MHRRKEVFREGPIKRDNGFYYLRQNRLPEAHRSFDYALWTDEAEAGTLEGLSSLYEKYLLYDRANEIVNTGLSHHPDDINILAQQAKVQYLSGQFEEGLISNYRSLPKRQQPPVFIFGVLKCKDAIEGCIGERAGHPLRDYSNVIKHVQAKKQKDREIALVNRWKLTPDPKIIKARQNKLRNKVLATITSAYPIRILGPPKTLPPDTEPLKKTSSRRLPTIKKQKNKKTKKEGKGGSRRKKVVPNVEKLSIPQTTQMDIELKPEVKVPEPMFKPMQPKTVNIKNYVAEKYLEKLARDKEELLICIDEDNIANPNHKGCHLIRKEATRAYNSLVTCQDVLRTRKPFYSIKYAEIEATKRLAAKNEADNQWIQIMAKRDADMFLAVLRSARENLQLKLCQDITERAKIFFDSKTKKVLPRKDEYLEIIYNIIGLAYLDSYRLNQHDPKEDDIRIKYMLGLPTGEIYFKDSVILAMAPGFADIRKKILNSETRILFAKSALELAWLYYDLARQLIESKQYEYGRHYAMQCVRVADAMGNEVWAINGTALIIKVYVNLRNRNEAKDSTLAAIDRSTKIYYKQKYELMSYFTRVLDFVEELDFDDIAFGNAMAQRERDILKLIKDRDIQAKVDVLFKKLERIPEHRRVALMPGASHKRSQKPLSANTRYATIAEAEKTRQPLRPLKSYMADAFLELL